MPIPKSTVESILSASKIEDVVSTFYKLSKAGSNYYTKCPLCGKEGKGKGLTVNASKQIYKCFSCGFSGKSPINFLMETQNYTYPEALKWLGDYYSIEVKDDYVKGPQKRNNINTETFRDKQLALSGITSEDQKALVFVDENTQQEIDIFEPATRGDDGRIGPGDDMLIWYFDLQGKPIEYLIPKSTKTTRLWRIRWQMPDLHRDKHNKSMKYSSPYGSGSHLFIPEIVRNAYKNRRVIKRLYIQEGEKKAIKACKHGIFSVGVMGIQNIGSNNRLPYDLQLLIQHCQIQEVVFVLDSDFNELSNELKPGSRVDLRPLSFYYAVRTFKEYFKAFSNTGIYLEIYFSHIKKNDKNDKGLDDLLTNSLKDNEHDLAEDFDFAMNQKDGTGKFVNVYKISTITDIKLLEFWNLHSAESFSEFYREQLKDLVEFQIGKHKWKFSDSGQIVPSQPLADDEQYWKKEEREDKFGRPIVQHKFKYMYCYNFLNRRGFGRYRQVNNTDAFVYIKDKVVEVVDSYFMRDFVTEFTKEIASKEDLVDVMDMLYRGGKMYLGPDSLSNLSYVNPYFEIADKSFQYMYFREKVWKITAQGVEERNYSELDHFVWKDKVINMDAKYIKPTYDSVLNTNSNDFIHVVRIDDKVLKEYPDFDLTPFIGQFFVFFSKEAEQCHFAKFMWNTSEFFWRKYLHQETRTKIEDTRTSDEQFETSLNFVSKMTAIGYLLHKYRDKSCEKAVIAMDGKISEVGESNGRTGKSILGNAIGKIVPQAYIGAKSKELTSDPFIWEEVSEKTESIFLDDVRANVDFEFFFPLITGQLTVNVKSQKKFTLPEVNTPKLFITTNHAINGNSASFRDRQFLVAFSDFYNDTHKPTDDFGINFFTEWDEKQYTLFYNFKAACLQLYFKAQALGWGINKSGLISPPTDRLDRRRLRQFIGESYLLWADEYFSISDGMDPADAISNNLNHPIPRKELYDHFLERNPNDRKYTTPHHFKKKMKSWCDYRSMIFNPHKRDGFGRPGLDDKSGGIEFFFIGNQDISKYGG
ncbi:MAG: DNA primase [Lentimicrobium sp.]|nr:DNA primase [Lentimicrobium sp.]